MFHLMPFNGRNENNLFNYLDNLEKNFFQADFSDFSQFRCDIIDKGSCYALQAELPGFLKEEIKIDLKDNMLTISAEHKEENETKEHNFVRRERKYGSFSRSFDVSGIDTEKIGASYNNGVLSLDLPKLETQLPQSKQINID